MATPAQGPWLKYQQQSQEQGPWLKYQKQQQPTTPPSPTDTQAPPEDTFNQLGRDFGSAVGGVAKGVGKGLLSLGTALSPYIHKIPYVGETLAPEQGILRAQELSQPTNTAQRVGYGAEKAAEFLAPGGLEERGAGFLAEHAPMLGRFAAPAARTLTGALSTGTVNKLQGGSFKTGAELGGGLGVAGEAGRAVAPSIAESALGVTKRMRGFGRTPGKAALDEIGGVRPETLAGNAQAKARQLTTDLESRAAASTAPASTAPALKVIDAEQTKAIRQNNRGYYDQLHALREQLSKDVFTGQPFPQDIPASQILDLKRGVGNLEKSWNPEQRGAMRGTIRKVYAALDGELDRTVPGAKEINQRISSLIPVSQRGESVARGASIPQRLGGRMAAHTGALTAAGLGGVLGYDKYGSTGAGLGAAAGLLVPELLASPEMQMAAARTLRSGVPARLGRGFLPVARLNEQ